MSSDGRLLIGGDVLQAGEKQVLHLFSPQWLKDLSEDLSLSAHHGLLPLEGPASRIMEWLLESMATRERAAERTG